MEAWVEELRWCRRRACRPTLGVMTATNRAVKMFLVHLAEVVDTVEDVVEVDCRYQLITCGRSALGFSFKEDVMR